MFFAAVPLALVATEPHLLVNAPVTLFYSSIGISVLQTVRGVLAQHNDGFSSLLMGVLALLLAPAVAGGLVLFGAPVTYSLAETLACAMVISTLALQPLLTSYGLDAATWRRIVSLQLAPSGVYYGSIGTLVGAWFGAVPIALDWDRPWQAYPITIVLGAYAGSALGIVLGSLLETSGRSASKPAKTRTRIVSGKRKVVSRR